MKSNTSKRKKPHEHSATGRYGAALNMKHNVLESRAAKELFKKSDDGIQKIVYLEELYADVPKHLQGVSVKVMELHHFDCSPILKKKVKKWLNSDS